MSKSCTKITKDKMIKIEENKRKAVFRNKSGSTHHVSRIDGCLVEDGPRADYLVSEEDGVSVIVELKGSDVSRACEQVFASVAHPEVQPLLKKKVGFLVICSKYPRFDSFVIKAKQRAAKMHKSGFHVVCDRGEFDLNRVAEIDGPF